MGNHAELLKTDGLYARLTRRQADAVAWSSCEPKYILSQLIEAFNFQSKYRVNVNAASLVSSTFLFFFTGG